MPQSESYRNNLARLKAQEASLRNDLSSHERDAAKAREEARRKRDAAARANSPSSRKSYLASAEREQRKALDADKRAARIHRKLADNVKAQADKSRSLESAEKSERATAEREEVRRRKKEADHAKEMAKRRADAEREEEKRRRKELDHSREIARNLRPTVRYVHVRAPEPERLRVLYLTSNPYLDLRTEAEVRNVQQALRGSNFRDQVEIHSRPAATVQDLLDGLNDVRPHIVHFSGHGGEQSLAFHDGNADQPNGQLVRFGLLAQALGATTTPPTLLVLNACNTLDGVDEFLPMVPLIVAMSDAVPDPAASLFAEQFYAAIASAQSVGAALAQARVKMQLELLDGVSALPELVMRNDVNVDELVLIAFPEGPATHPFTSTPL